MSRRLTFFCTIACSVAAACSAAVEPNETFSTATVLEPGIFTTGPQSFGDGGLGITYPDTTLGFFTNTTYSQLFFRNDDSSPFGDGQASAIQSRAVNPDGSVPLAVSGYRDLNNFDGLNDHDGLPHSQSGNVRLTLTIWDTEVPGVEFDRQVRDIELLPGEVARFPFVDSSWIGHTFSAIVDNTIDGGNDVDFWRFTGLPPGALFTAGITSETPRQDTLLRLLDPAGGETIAESNDDINFDTYLSALRSVVGETGEVVLGVTSFDDFDFIGAHGGAGDYTLSLTYDGDTDGDMDVDGDDLLNMLLSFGLPGGATPAQGDADGDGDVDRDDLLVWQTNAGVGTLGRITPMPPEPTSELSGGVPEPSAIMMLGTALAALAIRRLTRSFRRTPLDSPFRPHSSSRATGTDDEQSHRSSVVPLRRRRFRRALRLGHPAPKSQDREDYAMLSGRVLEMLLIRGT